MKTSVIQWPRADRFIRVHESLLKATKGNACAAALIAFFERWHNYRLEQLEYDEEYDIEAKPILDKDGWQFHTGKQLEAGVLIYKTEAITKATEILESLGFISTAVPKQLQILHKTGRTKWFLLLDNNINAYFVEQSAPPPPKTLTLMPAVIKEKKPLTAKQTQAIEIYAYRSRQRIACWAEKGRKLPKTPPSAKELQTIVDRLIEGFTATQLCMAIDGNLSSKFHQGGNDNNTIYDQISFVLVSGARVNQFITAAVSQGITEEMVTEQFRNETSTRNIIDHEPIGRYLAAIAIATDAITVQNVRIVRAMTNGVTLNFQALHSIIIPLVERSVGMYADQHRARLNEFAKLYKEQ